MLQFGKEAGNADTSEAMQITKCNLSHSLLAKILEFVPTHLLKVVLSDNN